MPEFDPRLLTQAQRELSQTLAERDGVARSVAERNAQIARLDTDMAKRSAIGDAAGVTALRAERERLAADRRAELERTRAFDDRLREIAGRLTPLIDACDADPTLPL